MEKPKKFIHWTNDHRVFRDAGLIRIGRFGIPVRFLFLLYGILIAVKATIAIIGASNDPDNQDKFSYNNDWSYIWDFLWVLAPVGGFIALALLVGIIGSVVDWFAVANEREDD